MSKSDPAQTRMALNQASRFLAIEQHLPAGLKFAGLCVGGALILLFAIERLLTGDYREPKATEGGD